MVFVSSEWPLVGLLGILIAAFFVLESRKGGVVVSHHQATRLVNSNAAVLLDVRDEKDFKAGHIVDSINIPFADLGKRVDELEKHKDKQVIMVDKMGQQTGAAGKILRDKGFNVVRLNGGVAEWTHQNLPLVKA